METLPHFEMVFLHYGKRMNELLHELASDVKLKILEKCKKILEIPGIKDKCPAGHLKSKL